MTTEVAKDSGEPGEVLIAERGALGIIRLNRPKALNSLTTAMCEAIHRQLDLWAVCNAIQAVMIVGAGEKAFCAGGDVVRVVQSYRAGGHGHFFHSEYRMNVAIDEFPKPYIALVDGIAMGGGVGVSLPGDYWIATERTRFAMPETGLGLFPDVGGGWFLPRLPGRVGLYLALSGARLAAGDLYHLGIATHVMAAGVEERLIDALAAGFDGPDALENILAAPHQAPAPGPVVGNKARIDRYFSGDSVAAIMAALENGDAWAQQEAEVLATKSPTALKLTFAQLARGARLTRFRDVMQMEFRMACRCVEGHDFPEGVRALLIDKDRRPRWSPATLDAVSEAEIAAYFAPLAVDDALFDR